MECKFNLISYANNVMPANNHAVNALIKSNNYNRYWELKNK